VQIGEGRGVELVSKLGQSCLRSRTDRACLNLPLPKFTEHSQRCFFLLRGHYPAPYIAQQLSIPYSKIPPTPEEPEPEPPQNRQNYTPVDTPPLSSQVMDLSYNVVASSTSRTFPLVLSSYSPGIPLFLQNARNSLPHTSKYVLVCPFACKPSRLTG
jgi:hypothetical protein